MTKVLKPQPKTPAASENASDKNTTPLNAKPSQLKTIELPSGIKATVMPAKGKHVVEAQRLMDGNPDLMLTALITVCTLIDNRKPTIEEVLEMDYLDYMFLLGEFQGGA